VALGLKEERKFNEAKDVYLAILRREPAHPEAMSQLGILASVMNMPQLAVKLLRQAVSVRPNAPDYHMNLGEALRGVGDMAGAEAAYRETLRLSPRDAGAMSLLGFVIAQQGRTEEAKAAFNAALAIEPGNDLATQCLGQLDRPARPSNA
jgi:Flp pilus assembly protein TadD